MLAAEEKEKRPSARRSVPAQGVDEKFDMDELRQALDSFASDRLSRHAIKVQASVERIKNPQLPLNQRVVLRGNNSFSGREGVIVGHDGNKVVVQVDGQSELCKVTVSLQSIEVIEEEKETRAAVTRREDRDFSEIHKLATIHAQRSARRQVQKLAEEAEERRKKVEHAQHMQHLTSQRDKGTKRIYQQRCKHGADCGKPGCTMLHPWEAGWITAGLGGKDSAANLRISQSVYSKHGPRQPGSKKNVVSHRPVQQEEIDIENDFNREEETEMLRRQAVLSIDRILSQAGLAPEARREAHVLLLPILLPSQADHSAGDDEDVDVDSSPEYQPRPGPDTNVPPSRDPCNADENEAQPLSPASQERARKRKEIVSEGNYRETETPEARRVRIVKLTAERKHQWRETKRERLRAELDAFLAREEGKLQGNDTCETPPFRRKFEDEMALAEQHALDVMDEENVAENLPAGDQSRQQKTVRFDADTFQDHDEQIDGFSDAHPSQPDLHPSVQVVAAGYASGSHSLPQHDAENVFVKAGTQNVQQQGVTGDLSTETANQDTQPHTSEKLCDVAGEKMSDVDTTEHEPMSTEQEYQEPHAIVQTAHGPPEMEQTRETAEDGESHVGGDVEAHEEDIAQSGIYAVDGLQGHMELMQEVDRRDRPGPDGVQADVDEEDMDGFEGATEQRDEPAEGRGQEDLGGIVHMIEIGGDDKVQEERGEITHMVQRVDTENVDEKGRRVVRWHEQVQDDVDDLEGSEDDGGGDDDDNELQQTVGLGMEPRSQDRHSYEEMSHQDPGKYSDNSYRHENMQGDDLSAGGDSGVRGEARGEGAGEAEGGGDGGNLLMEQLQMELQFLQDQRSRYHTLIDQETQSQRKNVVQIPSASVVRVSSDPSEIGSSRGFEALPNPKQQQQHMASRVPKSSTRTHPTLQQPVLTVKQPRLHSAQTQQQQQSKEQLDLPRSKVTLHKAGQQQQQPSEQLDPQRLKVILQKKAGTNEAVRVAEQKRVAEVAAQHQVQVPKQQKQISSKSLSARTNYTDSTAQPGLRVRGGSASDSNKMRAANSTGPRFDILSQKQHVQEEGYSLPSLPRPVRRDAATPTSGRSSATPDVCTELPVIDRWEGCGSGRTGSNEEVGRVFGSQRKEGAQNQTADDSESKIGCEKGRARVKLEGGKLDLERSSGRVSRGTVKGRS